MYKTYMYIARWYNQNPYKFTSEDEIAFYTALVEKNLIMKDYPASDFK